MRLHDYKRRVKLIWVSECWQFNSGFSCSGRINFFAEWVAILIPDVCFNTLQGLADVRIEWVTSLALHLEVDSSKKTLKLFQFPSFCRMMSVERETHILSR